MENRAQIEIKNVSNVMIEVWCLIFDASKFARGGGMQYHDECGLSGAGTAIVVSSIMPSLDFKGKQFVYTHHLTVPFRELVVDAKKSLPAKGKPTMDDNLIIHGDNLHALKALLPRYAGKVKCIYIDPPYNTGNEGWCYNDNVRSPLMQEWVERGNPVEREDMERHDKWLSMMWPRLNLLKELLSSDGLIFISIDDNEGHHIHSILDEIFGEQNFIATFVWNSTKSITNPAQVSVAHTYNFVYAKYPAPRLEGA